MKFIKEKMNMEINIEQKDEKIYFNFQGKNKEFTYDNIDFLIDELVKNDIDNITITASDELNNYKLLIEEIVKEVSSEDFKKTLKELSIEPTDEEIISSFSSTSK